MNEAPEGLDYGHSHQGEKNKPECELEKGKFESAMKSLPNSAEFMGAEALRMKDGGSHDPMYHDKHKNK